MATPRPVREPRARVPTPHSRTPTHIFQSDDVGVLPVPQKNFNLFRGVSLALVDDLRKGGACGSVGESTLESLPATEPHVAGHGVSAAHLPSIHRVSGTTRLRPVGQGYITHHLHRSRAALA